MTAGRGPRGTAPERTAGARTAPRRALPPPSPARHARRQAPQTACAGRRRCEPGGLRQRRLITRGGWLLAAIAVAGAVKGHWLRGWAAMMKLKGQPSRLQNTDCRLSKEHSMPVQWFGLANYQRCLASTPRPVACLRPLAAPGSRQPLPLQTAPAIYATRYF